MEKLSDLNVMGLDFSLEILLSDVAIRDGIRLQFVYKQRNSISNK